MNTHQIEFLGINLSEPATSFTNIVLAILCFILFRKINTDFNKTHYTNSWKYFFLFISISTGLGLAVHGFSNYMSDRTLNYFHLSLNLTAAIASYYCVKATNKYFSSNVKTRNKLNTVNFIILILFVLATLVLNNFEIVKLYIGIAVIFTLFVHFRGYLKDDNATGHITIGMLLSLCTIFIHSQQYSIFYWLDFNAISHLIMILSILLIFRGVSIFNYKLQSID